MQDDAVETFQICHYKDYEILKKYSLNIKMTFRLDVVTRTIEYFIVECAHISNILLGLNPFA